MKKEYPFRADGKNYLELYDDLGRDTLFGVKEVRGNRHESLLYFDDGEDMTVADANELARIIEDTYSDVRARGLKGSFYGETVPMVLVTKKGDSMSRWTQINEEKNMKKLPITKETFEKSKYFQKKYGKLEYVSESGKVFKTNKGKILKFNESIKDIAPGIQDWGTTVYIEKLGAEMSWDDIFFIVKKDCRQYPLLEEVLGLEPYEEPTNNQIKKWIKTNPESFIEYLEEFGTYNDNFADDDSDDSYDESTKKFGKKFTKENVEAPDEDLTCPNCGSNDIYVDAGYATCGNCDYSWELKDYTESVGDVSKDPAYVCPYCGGHNCEFSDGEDIGSGLQDGYFDGATVNTTFWCMDCEKPYNVQFKLKVSDVYPDESGDFDED